MNHTVRNVCEKWLILFFSIKETARSVYCLVSCSWSLPETFGLITLFPSIKGRWGHLFNLSPWIDEAHRDGRATCHWNRADQSIHQIRVAWEETFYGAPNATFRNIRWHILFVYRFQQ